MAGPFEAIARQAEEALRPMADGDPRIDPTEVGGQLAAFARLLRREPRLRLALTDIAMGPDSKRELLRSLLEGRST